MDVPNAHELATLVEEAAEEAEDFSDVADALRDSIEERDDSVHRLTQAFEYFLRVRDEASVTYQSMVQLGDQPPYPPSVEEVPDETVEVWASVVPHVSAPAGVARLNDLLFIRGVGNGRHRAEAAVDAYIELSRTWHPVYATKLLPRGLELAHRVGADERVKAVREAALGLVSAALEADGPKPGVPLRLLRTLVNDGWDDSRVDELLCRSREVLPDVNDVTSTITLQRRRAKTDADRQALDRAYVDAHLEAADGAEGFLRAHHLEAAADYARDHGLNDLHEQAMRVRQAMSVEDFDFQTFTSEAEIPREDIEAYIEAYLDAEDWKQALIRFAHLRPPCGHIDENKQSVREQNEEFPLQALMNPVLMGSDGLPRFQATTDEERFDLQLSQQEQLRLSFWAAYAVETLRRLEERFGRPDIDELEEWLQERPHVSPGVARSLRRALHFFWDGEYEAAFAIAIPRVEALCRSLVLLLDEPVYRLQRQETPGRYPGLRTLVPILEDHGLPQVWSRYVMTTFANITGLNLRHEQAHGFVDDPDVRPAVLAVHATLFLATLPLDMDGGEVDHEPPPDTE